MFVYNIFISIYKQIVSTTKTGNKQMENEITAEVENGIIIANIKWWKGHETKTKVNWNELPDSYQLSIPNNMISMYQNEYDKFLDEIETFCYNFLTRKFGVEVSYCQIWLPID